MVNRYFIEWVDEKVNCGGESYGQRKINFTGEKK